MQHLLNNWTVNKDTYTAVSRQRCDRTKRNGKTIVYQRVIIIKEHIAVGKSFKMENLSVVWK